VRKSGQILLQSPPIGVDVLDIKHDIESVPGILSVHELHVWRLNQHKALASAHVTVVDPSLELFQQQAKTISECLHAYGVHSVTLQPELAGKDFPLTYSGTDKSGLKDMTVCQINCGSSCEELTCCG
jgi:zinc transporter 1